MTTQKEHKRARKTAKRSLARKICAYLDNPNPNPDQLWLIEKILFSFMINTDLLMASELTDHELGCFRVTALGCSVRKTAEVLKISPKTVDYYRQIILQKLDSGNMLEAVAQGIKLGYLPIKVLEKPDEA